MKTKAVLGLTQIEDFEESPDGLWECRKQPLWKEYWKPLSEELYPCKKCIHIVGPPDEIKEMQRQFEWLFENICECTIGDYGERISWEHYRGDYITTEWDNRKRSIYLHDFTPAEILFLVRFVEYMIKSYGYSIGWKVYCENVVKE